MYNYVSLILNRFWSACKWFVELHSSLSFKIHLISNNSMFNMFVFIPNMQTLYSVINSLAWWFYQGAPEVRTLTEKKRWPREDWWLVASPLLSERLKRWINANASQLFADTNSDLIDSCQPFADNRKYFQKCCQHFFLVQRIGGTSLAPYLWTSPIVKRVALIVQIPCASSKTGSISLDLFKVAFYKLMCVRPECQQLLVFADCFGNKHRWGYLRCFLQAVRRRKWPSLENNHCLLECSLEVQGIVWNS